MSRNILVILLTIYLSLKCASSNPVEERSFVEEIYFKYVNEEWTCGEPYHCPLNTFGCKIIEKTSEDGRRLHQAFNCIDEEGYVTQSIADTIQFDKKKHIEINLETYVGAVSVYSVSYGLGYEGATGVVAVDELEQLKEEFRKLKNKTSNRFKE